MRLGVMATQVSSSLSEKQAQGHGFWFNSKSRTKTEIFQLVEYVVWNHEVVGSSPAFCTKRFVGIMVISQIVDLLSRVRFPYEPQDVGFSLFGKVSHCECEEQGSIPEVNRK